MVAVLKVTASSALWQDKMLDQEEPSSLGTCCDASATRGLALYLVASAAPLGKKMKQRLLPPHFQSLLQL